MADDGGRAVIFDLDDTLYREHDYVRSGFAAVARRLAAEPTAPAVDDLFNALVCEWQAHGRGHVFDVVAARHGLDVGVAELVAVYREHDPQLELYPDAERALARLEAAGRLVGVLTDGMASVQRRKLKALGLDQRIRCIVVSDDYGLDAWKPSAVPYRAALEHLGVAPADAVYVGDNPNKDFIGARALGLATVRVKRETGDHAQTVLDPSYEADVTVATLDEVFV
ncbi:HAD family hydrolase [Solirubrobacter soli]|uniref:HAD family hydrolase n=1 Tax=Solirubrobacter soli TaxID=363832 RepID=UPI00040F51C6|nr:HAD-IA family hydrolase [Solirubrobacter soli]